MSEVFLFLRALLCEQDQARPFLARPRFSLILLLVDPQKKQITSRENCRKTWAKSNYDF